MLRQVDVNIHHLKNRFAEQCTVLNSLPPLTVQLPVVAEVAQVFAASPWQKSIESTVTLAENPFLKESENRNIAPEFDRRKSVI